MRGKPGFRRYEAVDHTGDLAFLARGRTREELFENAAQGMISLLIDLRTVRATEKHPLQADGADGEECLVGWLQEILYQLEVHRRLFRRFEVENAGPPRVRSIGWGEPLDSVRHDVRVQVKAATYHDLRIRTAPSAVGTLYVARVVLDI